jgi:NAD(P)-dependent dehydrogenase (short-subunit alcohol dehydrogenase family)
MVRMAQRLLNKVAVVTGASGVLGRAVVHKFLAEGAKVVVFGRNRGRLDELAAGTPARVLVVEGDVTKADDLDGLVETTVRRFGTVDVLVGAATLFRTASLGDCTAELVSEIFAVNLQGALQTVRAFERQLNRGASIVFVTTPAPTASREGLGPFAASKAALASLARTLAVELSPRGIRVNSVSPGRIDDPRGAMPTDLGGRAVEDTPPQSRGRGTQRSDQVAEAALFLACDNAAGVTGQELVIDAPTA